MPFVVLWSDIAPGSYPRGKGLPPNCAAGTAIMLASFRCMTNFVFDPPLRLARDVTVRTLDDAAEFARTFVGPRLPHRRDRLVRRLQEVSDNASARIAARSFARGQ
jgi:hypothetical protein